MLKAYTLRSEYEGKLVGATCVSGPDGVSIDVLEELDANDGQITTDDFVLQSVLENLYAADGLLLDAHVVDSEGNLSKLENPGPSLPQPETASAMSELPTPPPQGEAPQHGEGGYHDMPKEELKEVATDRGLAYKANASKPELVAMLEESDKQAVTPDQS